MLLHKRNEDMKIMYNYILLNNCLSSIIDEIYTNIIYI